MNGLARIKRVKWTTLILAIIILAVNASNEERKITYDGDQVWRIHKNNSSVEGLLQRYNEYGSYSIWSNGISTADIFVQSDNLQDVESILKKSGVKYDVLIDDVQHAIEEENPPPSIQAQAKLDGRAGHRMEWTRYYRYSEIMQFLEDLANSHPSFATIEIIGKSIEGRPLKVLKINCGKKNAPTMWIDGGIHAREWISPATVTYIINYLMENKESLDMNYHIMPVINPDGYEFTHTYNRLWRKNRRNNGRCAGVDLNRNFGYKWGGLGTSSNPCNDIYRGPRAFSEPESDAIRKYFETNSAKFKAYLSFHSYGQYIMHPWGYDRVRTSDDAELATLGRKAANAMWQATNDKSSYTIGNTAMVMYPAAGGTHDWAKGAHGIKYAYVIELRDNGKYGFILPASLIIPTAKEGLAGMKVIAEAAKNA